jgi:hypothetical protein
MNEAEDSDLFEAHDLAQFFLCDDLDINPDMIQ